MRINQGIKSRDELHHPHKIGGRRWIRIALWVMIIALVGWYFLLGDETRQRSGIEARNRPERSDAPLTMENDSSAVFRVPSMVDESQEGGPETPPSAAPLSTAVIKKGDQAREILREIRGREEKTDISEVFRHAERFRDEGMLVDAHLMYFFAAKQGHAESALILGTMYDPEHALEVPNVIAEPDSTQAYKWYLRAVEAGSEKARRRLEYLRKQVERAAANGDVEAGRLVLQWR